MGVKTKPPGPGTYVQDALAASLYNATISSATTTNGSWVEVEFPHDVAVEVVTGTLTGASATIDIEVQGADTNSGTNTVSYGRFKRLTDADDVVRRVMQAKVYKKWMRVVIITAGTVTSFPLTIKVREPRDQVTSTTSA
jgi:predicted secreted protein